MQDLTQQCGRIESLPAVADSHHECSEVQPSMCTIVEGIIARPQICACHIRFQRVEHCCI